MPLARALIPTHPWTKQTRILLPLFLTIVLLVVPASTMAQEPSSNTYGSDLTTPARRPLDTWGRGPFCWSCHNLVNRTILSTTFIHFLIAVIILLTFLIFISSISCSRCDVNTTPDQYQYLDNYLKVCNDIGKLESHPIRFYNKIFSRWPILV